MNRKCRLTVSARIRARGAYLEFWFLRGGWGVGGGGGVFEWGAYKKSEFLLFKKTFFNIIVRHENKNTEDK